MRNLVIGIVVIALLLSIVVTVASTESCPFEKWSVATINGFNIVFVYDGEYVGYFGIADGEFKEISPADVDVKHSTTSADVYGMVVDAGNEDYYNLVYKNPEKSRLEYVSVYPSAMKIVEPAIDDLGVSVPIAIGKSEYEWYINTTTGYLYAIGAKDGIFRRVKLPGWEVEVPCNISGFTL